MLIWKEYTEKKTGNGNLDNADIEGAVQHGPKTRSEIEFVLSIKKSDAPTETVRDNA